MTECRACPGLALERGPAPASLNVALEPEPAPGLLNFVAEPEPAPALLNLVAEPGGLPPRKRGMTELFVLRDTMAKVTHRFELGLERVWPIPISRVIACKHYMTMSQLTVGLLKRF
jgi:hypothetical protein